MHPRRPLSRRASLAAAAGAVAAAGASVVAPAGDPALALQPAADSAAGPGLYVLGDSWAAGLHADPARALGQVAAEVLRSAVRVDAVSGTGYLNAAGDAPYPQRAAGARGDERLVVVQGGSNDDGQDLDALPAAITRTIDLLGRGFPQATVVLLGPGPDPLPLTPVQWRVDAILEEAAASAGTPYLSMLQEHWIPEDRSAAVIDPATAHPTVQGQEYLGIRLAAQLHLVVPGLV